MNTIKGFLCDRTELDQESKDNVETEKQTETPHTRGSKLYQIPCETRDFFTAVQNCPESVSLTLPGSLLFKHFLY